MHGRYCYSDFQISSFLLASVLVSAAKTVGLSSVDEGVAYIGRKVATVQLSPKNHTAGSEK